MSCCKCEAAETDELAGGASNMEVRFSRREERERDLDLSRSRLELLLLRCERLRLRLLLRRRSRLLLLVRRRSSRLDERLLLTVSWASIRKPPLEGGSSSEESVI